jgi:hypothetical protein
MTSGKPAEYKGIKDPPNRCMNLIRVFPSHKQDRSTLALKEFVPMLTILLIILILALLGVLPTWPYSHAWGYYPTGGLGLLLIIVIILMLL